MHLSTRAKGYLSNVRSSGDFRGTGGMEVAGGDGTTSLERWATDPGTCFCKVPKLGAAE